MMEIKIVHRGDTRHYATVHRDVGAAVLAGLVARYGVLPVITRCDASEIDIEINLDSPRSGFLPPSDTSCLGTLRETPR